ncbi:MAG: IS3 family transposase [Vicinamibacterales bacterium]
MRKLCRLFSVSSGGFDASRSRPESKRVQEDRRLNVLVHASFTGGRGYYGSPHIQDDFVEWSEHVSRKQIIRLMQDGGLKARVRKRYKGTTTSAHDQPVAVNSLQQESIRICTRSAKSRGAHCVAFSLGTRSRADRV